MQYGVFCFIAAEQNVCEETETESSRVHCILLDHIETWCPERLPGTEASQC